MNQFEARARLIPHIDSQDEWKYLVNETYIGEKCIVPLLQQILALDLNSASLNEALAVQLDEEIEHVRLFHRLVGADRLPGSGYDVRLKEYVRTLPKITLRLFALQGLLEGIALGALDYRLQIWERSPSRETDLRAKLEELGHVSASFAAFEDLVRIEGAVVPAEFRQVTKDVNALFVDAFSGDSLANFARECSSQEIDPQQIEDSRAMQWFRKQSAHTLVKNKDHFIRHYSKAVHRVAL